MNVLVLEPGTFKLGGGVSDSSGGTISGVTVEVLSGTGKGLKATTGHAKDRMPCMEWLGRCNCARPATALRHRFAMSLSRKTAEPNRLLSVL